MTFNHPYGDYNVEGSLNKWFETNLTAAGLPSWMPSARVVYGWDEESPLINGHSGHAFSVTYLGSDGTRPYQGRRMEASAIGDRREGLLEINAWVSKQQAGNSYRQRLAQAGDMVGHLLASARSVQINHVYGSLTKPTAIGAVVRLMDYNEPSVGADPNPDMLRRRFVVRYQWHQKVSG